MNISKFVKKFGAKFVNCQLSFVKFVSAALIGALLASNFSLSILNSQFSIDRSAFAIDGSGPDLSLNNYSVANESNPGAGYQTTVTAAVGDFLDVYMEAQNKNVPSDASNLVVKSYFPNFQGGAITTTGNVSTTTTCSTAGCKTSDSKTATINIPATARLVYQPGSAKVTADLNQDGTNELNGSALSDSLVMSADGANLGTLKGGSATVQISYRIAVVSVANPNLTVRFLTKNTSRSGTDWAASADASKDETVKFYLELHNTQVGSSAKNVRIKATIPSDFSTSANVKLDVTSDNAAAVSGTATVNFAKLSKLLTVPGSTRLVWDINGDGTREYNDSVWPNEDLFGAGILLPQDLNGCNQFILQLIFSTTVNEKVDTACTGTIGDYVWNDANGNGIQDSGEVGISGVTVTLKNAGGTVLSTTTTDANGIYHFNNLCAATYIVEVSGPAGFTSTTTNASGSTTANDSNPSPSTVILTANNSVDNTIDFGFKQNAAATNPNCSLTKKIKLPNGNEQTSVSASDHIYVPGEQIIYRLFVSNPGTGDASNVSISDLLPPYVYWVSGDGGYAAGDNKVNFDLGTLKAGESRTLTYTVKVRDNVPSGTTEQKNSAKITSPASLNTCTAESSLVVGKPGAVLAAAALPQTGTIPSSILATLGLVVTGLAVRLKKAKLYKYWGK